MKMFNWRHTQYSQFNSSDTLLLVSGVHFGTPISTAGEIAVFRLARNGTFSNSAADAKQAVSYFVLSVAAGFDLQCRVINKPYDIFGTWYSEHYLLSGNLCWLAHLVTTSVLWLNKASQETSSEHLPIVTQLFRYRVSILY